MHSDVWLHVDLFLELDFGLILLLKNSGDCDSVGWDSSLNKTDSSGGAQDLSKRQMLYYKLFHHINMKSVSHSTVWCVAEHKILLTVSSWHLSLLMKLLLVFHDTLCVCTVVKRVLFHFISVLLRIRKRNVKLSFKYLG